MQYKFRLQKLLDIRLDKEEESKRNFTSAQNEKLKVENKLNDLKNNYSKYRDMGTCKSAIDQKIRHAYLNNLTYTITETSKELRKKEKVLEEKRLELSQKQVERKTVEILKEKGREAFMKEQELIEQNMNDEFALYGFMRNLERR